jgi:hypothetical protein
VLLDRARDLKITALAGLTTEKMNALMEELQDLNVFRSTVDHDTYLLANKNFRDLLGADEEVLNNLIPYIGE